MFLRFSRFRMGLTKICSIFRWFSYGVPSESTAVARFARNGTSPAAPRGVHSAHRGLWRDPAAGEMEMEDLEHLDLT